MTLIKKLTNREINKGFISLSKDLLGSFYPIYTRTDIENTPNNKIRIDQLFHIPQLSNEVYNKRLEVRIKGGIVVELILNNIMQQLNLTGGDILLIEKITENEFNLNFIRETNFDDYTPLNERLNGKSFFIFKRTEEENEEIEVQDVEVKNEIDEQVEINQDTSPRLDELLLNTAPDVKERILKIRQRNKSIVKNLKELYQGHCQISGTKFTFKKKNGEFYSEVHHLIPLGEQGSDSYANAIVVSPLVHRMLHFANISEIDLSKIRDQKLPITINEQLFEITWHAQHLNIVMNTLKD